MKWLKTQTWDTSFKGLALNERQTTLIKLKVSITLIISSSFQEVRLTFCAILHLKIWP